VYGNFQTSQNRPVIVFPVPGDPCVKERKKVSSVDNTQSQRVSFYKYSLGLVPPYKNAPVVREAAIMELNGSLFLIAKSAIVSPAWLLSYTQIILATFSFSRRHLCEYCRHLMHDRII